MKRRDILVTVILISLLSPTVATATGFTSSGADTVRTNLWLAEALMAEAVREAAASLPAAPVDVVLVPVDTEPVTMLLATVVSEQLFDAGYSPLLETAPEVDAVGEVEFRFQVLEMTLDYPETGRRSGIWKSWIGREMLFVGLFSVVETSGGRILYNDRVSRGFRDRVPAQFFAGVESPAYDFTRADPQESGWKRRFEQIVVLGALAGLVAIYFANTQ